MAALNMRFHLNKILHLKNSDLYLGSLIGYDFADFKVSSTTPYPHELLPNLPNYQQLIYSFYAGYKHILIKRINVFGEVGYGLTVINAGLRYEF